MVNEIQKNNVGQFLYNNEHFSLQTNWLKFNCLGIPKADEYHNSEESRHYFKMPLESGSKTHDNLILLDNHIKKMIDKSCTYYPIVKESANVNFPKTVQFKFDKNTSFLFIDEDNKQIPIIWKNVDTLKNLIQKNSVIRFLFTVSLWKFNNRMGVRLKLHGMQWKDTQDVLPHFDFNSDEANENEQ